MKKTYNENELKELSNKVFAQFPNEKKVFATLDGNVFLSENHARLHVGINGRIIPFDRPISDESENDKKTKKATAQELIDAINNATTLEALEAYVDDKRATVVAALEEKRKQLTPVK